MSAPTKSHDAALVELLAARDVPCPGCGYNLRDLTSTSCPECGRALRLGLEGARPKLAAYVTGLIGRSASTGFSGVFAVYLLWDGFFRHWEMGPFTVFVACGLVASEALTALWISQFAPHRRHSDAARWFFAVASWIVPTANIIVFTAILG